MNAIGSNNDKNQENLREIKCRRQQHTFAIPQEESNGLQGATSGIKKQWFDRVERVSDFPLYLYIVAGCAD